jgi:ribosome maturation factor RimP
MNKALESVVESEVDALGYDVVLLRRGGTRSRPVLEIRIDRRDGERVSIDDCVRVSRAVEARLDAGAGDGSVFGGTRYELQVSSPGELGRARRKEAAEVGEHPEVTRPAARADGPTSAHTDEGSRDGRVD